MIIFEKINTLKIIYEKAYQSFIAQLFGDLYNEDYQKAIYKIDYATPFKDEFDTVLFNNLSDRTPLKAYIERVYYEDVVSLYIKFANLISYYQKRSKKDILQLASGEDGDLYNRIGAHTGGLRLLADKIYSEAQKHGIIDLKHYLQIEITDFVLQSGQYIALFPVPEEKPVKIKDEILFPKDTLTTILKPIAIERFIEFENRLIKNGYFDAEGTWCKEKEALVSIILNLKEKGYVKRNKSYKSEPAQNKLIREFFEGRYSTHIYKQMQPQYIISHRVNGKYPVSIDPLGN